MADIFLCGHGAWATKGRGTVFATVPGGTTLSVYTPIGRFFWVSARRARFCGATRGG